MKLTRQGLITLAAEEVLFGPGHDVLDRVCALALPFLGNEPGIPIFPDTISREIRKNYGLTASDEVAHVVLGRLARRGLIESEKVENGIVFATKQRRTIPTNEHSALVDEVIESFHKFIVDRPAIPRLEDDEILTLLREHLFRLESIALGSESHFDDREPDWKYSLISDYVISVTDHDGNLPPLLKRLSELSLIRHSISQLARTKDRKLKSNTIIVLDSPIALQTIGASGILQRQNMRSLLEASKSLGIRLAVFQDSVAEMARVLDAVLYEDHLNRQGPTAGALRRGEVSEVIIRDMQRSPKKYLANFGVSVLPHTINSHPDLQEFFPHSLYSEFCGFASRWASRMEAQNHDAAALALTHRLRRGASESTLFETTYCFVTNNWAFRNEAKRFCEERFMIKAASIPPVVHFSDFASSVWLAVGLESNDRIPERALLATCEKVLSSGLRPVVRLRDKISELVNIESEQLELLVRDRDAISYLTSQVANDPGLLNSSNIVEILRKAKQSVAHEVASEKDQIIDLVEAEKEELLIEIEQLKVEHEKQAVALREQMVRDADAMRQAFDRLVRDTEESKREILVQVAHRDDEIRRMEAERVREEQRARNGIEQRIRKFESDYLGRVDTHSNLFFIVVPIIGGIMTVFPVTLWSGIAVLSLSALLAFMGFLFDRGPVKWFKLAYRRRVAEQALRIEFSGAEIHEWGLVLDSESKLFSPKLTDSERLPSS